MDCSYFLVAASAASFYGALAYPSFFWLTFIFLLPLFYAALAHQINFKHGMVWGTMFWMPLLQPIFIMLHEKTQLGVFGAFFATAILVMYLSLYAGLWMWSADRLSRRTSQFLLTWFLVTLFYFFFIDQISLWVFEVVEGYQLVHPLLPLVHVPQLLWALSLLGKHILLASLILFQLSLVVAYAARKAFFWTVCFCSHSCFYWIFYTARKSCVTTMA